MAEASSGLLTAQRRSRTMLSAASPQPAPLKPIVCRTHIHRQRQAVYDATVSIWLWQKELSGTHFESGRCDCFRCIRRTFARFESHSKRAGAAQNGGHQASHKVLNPLTVRICEQNCKNPDANPDANSNTHSALSLQARALLADTVTSQTTECTRRAKPQGQHGNIRDCAPDGANDPARLCQSVSMNT